MASRQAMFIVSLLIGVIVHAFFLVLSPSIPMLRANSTAEEIQRTFKVDLYEGPIPEPVPAPMADAYDASMRPALADSLAGIGEETLPAPESLLDQLVEIPKLSERVASDPIERDHDLGRDTIISQKVDAKIIEIAESVARENIQIARRLVRPSPDRVLQKGEYPVFRVEGAALDEELLSFAPPPPSAAPGPQSEQEVNALEPPLEKPAFEEGVLRPERIEPALMELPIEMTVAREPLQEVIRKESPYEFIDDLVEIGLDTYVAPGEPQGFFRLRIAPKTGQSIEVLPKDVTFVIDASRSIMQRKLNLTARGIRRCIETLRPEDRFNLVVFRDSPTLFRDAPVPATDAAKEAAYALLENIESRGETDVYRAIRPVVERPPRAGLPSLVVVMSDGRPTTGVVDGREIINALTRNNLYRNSIYAFGGGRTVNRYLLELLAYRNKGESHITRRLDDIDEELPRFFSRFRDPILVALTADYGRIEAENVFPKEIPDFYRGRAVTIFGRYDPARETEFVMRLQGLAGSLRKELIFKADLAEAATGDSSIASSWAFQKTYYLIGEVARLGDRPELLAEIQRLSQRYGVRTSYTQ